MRKAHLCAWLATLWAAGRPVNDSRATPSITRGHSVTMSNPDRVPGLPARAPLATSRWQGTLWVKCREELVHQVGIVVPGDKAGMVHNSS